MAWVLLAVVVGVFAVVTILTSLSTHSVVTRIRAYNVRADGHSILIAHQHVCPPYLGFPAKEIFLSSAREREIITKATRRPGGVRIVYRCKIFKAEFVELTTSE